jgi:hypothetical protein
MTDVVTLQGITPSTVALDCKKRNGEEGERKNKQLTSSF